MRTLANNEAELIIALHNGLFEEPLWKSFLDLLKAETKAGYANLVFRSNDNSVITSLSSGKALSPHLKELFNERFGSDPLLYHKMRQDRVYALHELINVHDPVQRALRDDILNPGGVRHVRTMRITEKNGVDAWLSVMAREEFGAAVSFLFTRLAPHLHTAFRTFDTLEKERIRSSISSEAMGRLNFGWLIVDANCQILDSTQNISGILQRTNVIGRGRHNHLTFSSSILEKEVSQLVKDISIGKVTRPKAINLSRDPWMDILVTQTPKSGLSPGSNAAAIVYVSGDRHSQRNRREQLVDLFGLLPSEARLAWELAQGRTIAEAATELNLTLETARNYSKKIYSKTGARGQVELVRIILTSVLAIV